MNCREFNDRFEICEKPNQKGVFVIYDFKTCKHINIFFDRFRTAEEWLQSKGFEKNKEA